MLTSMFPLSVVASYGPDAPAPHRDGVAFPSQLSLYMLSFYHSLLYSDAGVKLLGSGSYLAGSSITSIGFLLGLPKRTEKVMSSETLFYLFHMFPIKSRISLYMMFNKVMETWLPGCKHVGHFKMGLYRDCLTFGHTLVVSRGTTVFGTSNFSLWGTFCSTLTVNLTLTFYHSDGPIDCFLNCPISVIMWLLL